MLTPGADMSAARWRKSSYSNGGADNCVEVADGFALVVPVRDSKAPDHVLTMPTASWRAFVGLVKN
ncbi:DUF397 domain-containing protein [Streptomyces avicenniae]|uniref:DUF397 domain-containing protein n=1 Tax=Streptomyces avicenniae TaxID=500153 RepID=UPI00069C9D47|nr:DUF397 domain-containing protein [Streptomyces avicenniae]